MDRYQLVKQLGRGNFGVVSVVRRLVDGGLFVMKTIDLSQLEESVKRQALNEAQLLSSLNHPCIVGYVESFLTNAPNILDEGAAGGDHSTDPKQPPQSSTSDLEQHAEHDTLVILMEYCAGGDVGEVIRKMKASEAQTSRSANASPPFSEDQILDWFIQLALALKYIHSRHILHRDLKAQNVFLTDDRRVKLGDFGISKVLNSEADFAKTVIGTPYYLSPEICEGKQYAKKSDVWSLGLFLYELCTLKHAFDGATLPALVMKILKGTYPPIPSCYSQSLHALISMMLQLNPAKRPNITQILRLEFVKSRLETLSKKYPEMKESWMTSMKLNTKKELFVQNLLPPPTPTAQPSPSRRKPSSHHTPAASHKPVSNAKRPTPTNAVSRANHSVGSRKSGTHLPARPKTPPPRSIVVEPAPAPEYEDEEDDDDDEDEEEDESEEGSSDSGAASSSSINSPSRVGIITAGWFDRAAEEYENLMKNLNDSTPKSPTSASSLSSSASAEDLYDPPTPTPASAIAAAGGPKTPRKSLKPSASASSVKAPTTGGRRPVASSSSNSSGVNRRKSDGHSALVLPSSKPVSIVPRASPKASVGSSFSPPMPDSMEGTASSSMPSPLQKMMQEIEDQKHRARLWKLEHRQQKANQKAAEMEVIQRHKAQLKAIRTRSSLVPNTATPASASTSEPDVGTSQESVGEPIVPLFRSQSEPQQPSNNDEPTSAKAKKLPPPPSPHQGIRSPNLKAAAGGARRKTTNPSPLSPSPRQPSPAGGGGSASATSTPDGKSTSSASTSSAPRVSVRDFISAKKKEALLAGSPSNAGPSVEVIMVAPNRERPDQPAPILMHEDSTGSNAGSNAGSAPASTKSAKKTPKREINFELVLQSSAQQQQQQAAQANEPITTPPVPMPTVPVLCSPLDKQPPLHPGSSNQPAATSIFSPGPNPMLSNIPFGSPAAASPMSSQNFTVEYASQFGPNSASTGTPSSTSPAPPSELVNHVLVRANSSSSNRSPTPPIVSPPANNTSSTSAVSVGVAPFLPASPSAPVTAPEPSPSRAMQLSAQISKARSLCCSMLGAETFEKCYAYLREQKRLKKANEANPAAPPVPSEAEQERVIKSWFKSSDQATAYSHIQSLIFCEDLATKM